MFHALFLYDCFLILHWVKFCNGFFQAGFFFIWETKQLVAGRLRQFLILYSNNFMGIGFGRLSIGSLRQVVVL